jgi:cellulose synthase/poly-beta-1,6-N-acetylglucosamine synthase-like glycosyltransferase
VDVIITALAIAFCAVASIFLAMDLGSVLLNRLAAGDLHGAALQGTFIAIIGVMQFSVFIYMITRLAQLRRHESHRALRADELESLYDNPHAPSLAVLVPAYKEDVRVIRRTLLSAALLDYPNKRVVLLIDNPPVSNRRQDLNLLYETRLLAQELDSLPDTFCLPNNRS